MMPVHTTYYNIYKRAPLYVEMYLPTVALVAYVTTEIVSPYASFRMIRFDPDDFSLVCSNYIQLYSCRGQSKSS